MERETDSRLLMSEEIVGMVPDLEEDGIGRYEDAFVIAALELRYKEGVRPVVGSVTGLSAGREMKIDLRVPIRDAHAVVLSTLMGIQTLCDAIQIVYADSDERIVGPYIVHEPKMMDFDRESKMCTLAVDLIKVSDI